ncbi:MAG: hypothetical protein B6I25_04360 [Planctomycetales bacterium 4572_13]|nr:MAG: hypothetical protein B6I25_04360 [Planctomycetales bacterium 4572_13]
MKFAFKAALESIIFRVPKTTTKPLPSVQQKQLLKTIVQLRCDVDKKKVNFFLLFVKKLLRCYSYSRVFNSFV